MAIKAVAAVGHTLGGAHNGGEGSGGPPSDNF